MTMQAEMKDTTLVLHLAGRVDTSNAAQVEQEVEAKRAEAHESIILDVENLEYISSAGLRVILRLRKAEPSLKVENANAEVYEVLEMTGFTEMIPVSKAYRHLSVDGCDVIGQGSNGIVYRYDPETIIKVYRNPDCLPDVTRERELSRRAFVLGINTAIPYDIVKVGDKFGSVFELLNARSFAEILSAEPQKMDEIVGLYVDLLKSIHAIEDHGDEFPDSHITVRDWANFVKDYLPAAEGEKLVRLVGELPRTYHLIHGDYHINNVMMQNGEVILIDMDTLSTGHPVVELASVFNAYIGFRIPQPDAMQKFFGITNEVADTLWEKTIRTYLGTDDDAKVQAVIDKAAVIGYTRLLRRTVRRMDTTTGEGKAALEKMQSLLVDLIRRVDTLLF